jgi:hypothetical protein
MNHLFNFFNRLYRRRHWQGAFWFNWNNRLLVDSRRSLDALGLIEKTLKLYHSSLRQQRIAHVTYYSGLLNLEYERKTGTPLIFTRSYLALSRTNVASSTEWNSMNAKSL